MTKLPQRAVDNFHGKWTPEPNSGCWLWEGSYCVDERGRRTYGRVIVNRLRKQWRAHRVSYEVFCGPIPPGMVVCHKCDNMACVNPDHLFLGTHADNVADKVKKGRAKGPVDPRGVNNGMAKLTDEAVREIRKLWRAGWSATDIAPFFGVTAGAIDFAARGVTWAHVK